MARQQSSNDEAQRTRAHKEVFGVVDRGNQSFWTRIGVAFVNEDGSLNLLFNYLPRDHNATIQVRDPRPRED